MSAGGGGECRGLGGGAGGEGDDLEGDTGRGGAEADGGADGGLVVAVVDVEEADGLDGRAELSERDAEDEEGEVVWVRGGRVPRRAPRPVRPPAGAARCPGPLPLSRLACSVSRRWQDRQSASRLRQSFAPGWSGRRSSRWWTSTAGAPHRSQRGWAAR